MVSSALTGVVEPAFGIAALGATLLAAVAVNPRLALPRTGRALSLPARRALTWAAALTGMPARWLLLRFTSGRTVDPGPTRSLPTARRRLAEMPRSLAVTSWSLTVVHRSLTVMDRGLAVMHRSLTVATRLLWPTPHHHRGLLAAGCPAVLRARPWAVGAVDPIGARPSCTGIHSCRTSRGRTGLDRPAVAIRAGAPGHAAKPDHLGRRVVAGVAIAVSTELGGFAAAPDAEHTHTDHDQADQTKPTDNQGDVVIAHVPLPRFTGAGADCTFGCCGRGRRFIPFDGVGKVIVTVQVANTAGVRRTRQSTRQLAQWAPGRRPS